MEGVQIHDFDFSKLMEFAAEAGAPVRNNTLFEKQTAVREMFSHQLYILPKNNKSYFIRNIY